MYSPKKGIKGFAVGRPHGSRSVDRGQWQVKSSAAAVGAVFDRRRRAAATPRY